jgi:hypothetical protein
MEIYKTIKDYEGIYEVSDFGNVRTKKTGYITKGSKTKKGYLKVGLYKDKKRKLFYVHRLVALNFLENPENKPEVDHIDRNKQNNRIENLKWATNSENQINTGLNITNTSGVKGVCFHKSKNKYQAYIYKNGKLTTLGRYATFEEAVAVRHQGELEFYGQHLVY